MSWWGWRSGTLVLLKVSAVTLAVCFAIGGTPEIAFAADTDGVGEKASSAAAQVSPPDDARAIMLGRDYTAQITSHVLDAIRDKVEFVRAFAAPPPPKVLENHSVASETEKVAIAKWARLRDRYLQGLEALQQDMPPASPEETAFRAGYFSLESQVAWQVSLLIAGLDAGKLTYADFAQQRADASIRAGEEMQAWLRAGAKEDEQSRAAEERLVKQRFEEWLQSWWTTYRPLVEELKRMPLKGVPFEDCAVSGTAWSCHRIE